MAAQVIHIREAPKDFSSNPDYVYIGRGSIWGNPFKMNPCPTLKNNSLPPVIAQKIAELYAIQERYRVINAYHAYLNYSFELQARLHELKDKHLVCYCSPKPCHGDVLVQAVVNLQYATVAEIKPDLNDLTAWLAA